MTTAFIVKPGTKRRTQPVMIVEILRKTEFLDPITNNFAILKHENFKILA